MRNLIVIALLAGSAYLAWSTPAVRALLPGRSLVEIEDSRVVLEAGQLEARFARLGSFAEAYMVFGGTGATQRNSLTHVALAGLPMREARLIQMSHPDFHRCASQGADAAKRAIETLSFVAADAAARRTLNDALVLHGKRIRSDGERTCVTVRGARLGLESVQLTDGGRDITDRVAPAFADASFYLAEQVELESCEELLR